jgi:hypothetical protein
MLTVYRVMVPTVKFQCFHTDDTAFVEDVFPRFHSEPIEEKWKAPEVYIHKPRLKEGNFIGFLGGFIFAIKADTLKAFYELTGFFEQSGEQLPLEYKNVQYVVFNCTNCLNALDQKKAVLSPSRQLIKEYVFHPKRFHFSLFTIPESRELLCVEGIDAPNDEFKGYVEERGLTGLIFEKLWSEESK